MICDASTVRFNETRWKQARLRSYLHENKRCNVVLFTISYSHHVDDDARRYGWYKCRVCHAMVIDTQTLTKRRCRLSHVIWSSYWSVVSWTTCWPTHIWPELHSCEVGIFLTMCFDEMTVRNRENTCSNVMFMWRTHRFQRDKVSIYIQQVTRIMGMKMICDTPIGSRYFSHASERQSRFHFHQFWTSTHWWPTRSWREWRGFQSKHTYGWEITTASYSWSNTSRNRGEVGKTVISTKIHSHSPTHSYQTCSSMCVTCISM